MATNHDADPYKSAATLTDTAGQEDIQTVFTTPHGDSFRISDEKLYLPEPIGAYDANNGIDKDTFTDCNVTTVSVIPTVKVAFGYTLTTTLAIIAVLLIPAIAGILAAFGIITFLTTSLLLARGLYQSSHAAAVTLHIRHYSTQFIIEGNKDEINNLEQTLLTEFSTGN